MPLDGLSLDLDDGLTRGRVKDLILYLHNRLKKVGRPISSLLLFFWSFVVLDQDICNCYCYIGFNNDIKDCLPSIRLSAIIE